MMSRTCCSAISAGWRNGPQLPLSAGISTAASQWPLTWPNRSSWGRTARSMPGRASSSVLTRGAYDSADLHDALAQRATVRQVLEGAGEPVEVVRRTDRRPDGAGLEHRQQEVP